MRIITIYDDKELVICRYNRRDEKMISIMRKGTNEFIDISSEAFWDMIGVLKYSPETLTDG